MISISLITLGDPDQLTGGYLYHQRLAELAKANDARVRFVPFPPVRYPMPIGWGGAVLLQASGGADVVLVDSIAAAYLAPWLFVRRRYPLPLVAIVHQPPGGVDHGPVRRRVQAALDLATYRRCAALVLTGEVLADALPPGLRSGREVIVVPPGRDVTDSMRRDVGDLRRGRRAALLCVANWLENKGILELLDAFAVLPDHLATLHLVGSTDRDPAYTRRVRARLREPDLGGRVVVHGPVDGTTVAGLYRAADALVLASRWESYGTVVGEAMAYGLPIVGWRTANLPNLVTNEYEGLLVAPDDLAALTAALGRMCSDDEFRHRLGDSARQRAESFPTWSQSAERLFALLRDLVEP